MIFGIGTDLVHIPRFQKLYARFPERLPHRILAPVEWNDFEIYLATTKDPSPARYLAKRFAAKEALVKAFGTGMRDGLSFHDFVITKNKLGKPSVTLKGHALNLFQTHYLKEAHISISDERDYVLAFVVIDK